ncbi:MAG: hypothetical protein E7575_07025 [Ruminococcaceae bacterium]|nr:hypothetical protein [Oscillospiraceae bacterium]
MLLIGACAVLFIYIHQSTVLTEDAKKCLGASFCAVSGALLISLFSIYSTIHSYEVKRDEYVQKQIDAGYDTVTVCTLPYNSYVWVGNPDAEPWTERYKLFHGIAPDIKFRFISYSEFDKWVEEFDKE